jgi:hypothetical protein
MVDRRNFLTGLVTSLIAAPWIVRSGISRGILMPIRRVILPPKWLSIYAIPDGADDVPSPGFLVGSVTMADGAEAPCGLLRSVILPPGKFRVIIRDDRGLALPSSWATIHRNKFRNYDGDYQDIFADIAVKVPA